MTCNNCIHQTACFDWCRGFGQEAELCEHYSDKAQWARLPVEVGEQVFVVYVDEIQHTDVSSIKIESEDDHFVFIVKCMVSWGGARFEEFIFGKTVFLTREKAEKALDEQRKMLNGGEKSMIKIIKDGQKDFIAKCPTCGCEFSYQLGDIGLNSVMCPCCGRYVAHKQFEEPSLGAGTYAIPCKFTQQTTADWIAPDVTVTSSNFESLRTIHDLCVDYDGFNTVDGLKSLIDDVRAITEETMK